MDTGLTNRRRFLRVAALTTVSGAVLGGGGVAAVIENVSGDSYEGFLAEALFGPAGMADTGYVLPGWVPARLVAEFEPDGTPGGLPTDLPWDDDGPYWNLRGNGGLLSTAGDMLA